MKRSLKYKVILDIDGFPELLSYSSVIFKIHVFEDDGTIFPGSGNAMFLFISI